MCTGPKWPFWAKLVKIDIYLVDVLDLAAHVNQAFYPSLLVLTNWHMTKTSY